MCVHNFCVVMIAIYRINMCLQAIISHLQPLITSFKVKNCISAVLRRVFPTPMRMIRIIAKHTILKMTRSVQLKTQISILNYNTKKESIF